MITGTVIFALDVKVIGIASGKKQNKGLQKADRIFNGFYEVTPEMLEIV